MNSNFSSITNPGAVKIGYFSKYSGFSVSGVVIYSISGITITGGALPLQFEWNGILTTNQD